MPIRKVTPAYHRSLAGLVAVSCLLMVPSCTAYAGYDAFELRGSVDIFPLASAGAVPAVFVAALPWKTLLLLCHVLGVALGFGAAIFLDLYLLRHLYWQPVSHLTLDLVRFGERLVAAGLAVLWLSGIGFLLLCYLDTPEKLANPKLWSKIAIVSALTLNGFVIHRIVRPRLQARIGRPLLADADLPQAMPLLAVAAFSATSWTTAFVLGIVRELNFVVPGAMIMIAYSVTVALALTGGCAFHLLSNKSLAVRRRAAPREQIKAPDPAQMRG